MKFSMTKWTEELYANSANGNYFAHHFCYHGNISGDTASMTVLASQKGYQSGGDELWRSASVLLMLY